MANGGASVVRWLGWAVRVLRWTTVVLLAAEIAVCLRGRRPRCSESVGPQPSSERTRRAWPEARAPTIVELQRWLAELRSQAGRSYGGSCTIERLIRDLEAKIEHRRGAA